MSNYKKIHEKYHTRTKRQKSLIKENNFTYRLILDVLNRKIKGSNKRILDIGCGAGTLSLYLASKGHEVTGIDISSKAIIECNNSKELLGLNSLVFKEMDFPNIFPNKKFDAVIFTEVIEHLNDDNKALNVIYGILKPNGIMILSTPSDQAPLHKLGITKKFDQEVGHLRRYSPSLVKQMIIDSGFKITEIQKTEGIIRNFLFINPIAGKLIRFFKFFISDTVTYIDNMTVPILGHSNIIIVAKKA